MSDEKKPGDVKFGEIIKVLTSIHKDFPSLRFGDVLQAAADLKRRAPNANLNDLSSKQILQALEEHYGNLKKKKLKPLTEKEVKNAKG